MRTVYIAEDEREFDNEQACRDYETENGFDNVDKIIKGVSPDGERLLFSGSKQDFYERVTYLYLANRAAVDLFNKICDRRGYCSDGIKDPGFYSYGLSDLYHDIPTYPFWFSLDKAIALYYEKLGELKAFKEQLLEG